ncbi:MAG: lysine--tRNA ligase [Nitrosopumilus sp.]|nr:lysine--tRNA ligase [Nitrosopumilus sp.]
MEDSLEEITIGKGTWIDKVAFTIIEREKKLGRSVDLIKVESGLGASGIPHIGSMGDAVRAFGISLALQDMGYKSELIAFSDDLDGLRKVPEGLPEWLNDYLCKPVSSIPDPFGDCHESYGSHMSSLLLEGLDRVGVNYKFKSGTEVYKSGVLSNQIHNILENSKIIGDEIAVSTGQQKYTKFLPFFPICDQCGRLYVANAVDYFPKEKTISYSCIGNTINRKHVDGCGYSGEIRIGNGNGNGKLAWKVEFAARWHAFDVRFEAFGKDIMDSVRINDWVSSEILGFHHPLHIKYEMFLDKGGRKISKSAGNVLTPQMWLKYGTPESLLLLLYKRISGTRHVSIEDIPNLMDEYDLYEDIFFDKIKEKNKNKTTKIKGVYEYVNNLNPPHMPSIHIPYRILIQQSELFVDQNIDSIKKINERLLKYGIIKEEDTELSNKIKLALNWAREIKEIYDEEISTKIQLEDKQKKAIAEVLSLLNPIANEMERSSAIIDNDELYQKVQTIIFQKPKENGIQPKDFFRLFYRILINVDKGPRLGNYIVDLGIKNVIHKIEKKIT